MKKNFWQILLGTLTIMLGFSACKKEKTCRSCISYNDKQLGKSTLCVGDIFMYTDEDIQNQKVLLQSEGYTVTESQDCSY